MAKHSLPAEDEQASKKARYGTDQDIRLSQQRAPLPSPFITGPWKACEVSSDLPPLPPISDPTVEAAVFAHRGLQAHSSENYERYEWLGDAYIETIASSLIFQTFNSYSAGRCTQLREILVRNSTLADYFRQYQLSSRARLGSDLWQQESRVEDRIKDKSVLKIHADIFEAYVGALVVTDPQNGIGTATQWLKALWGRTIQNDIIKEEELKAKKQSSQPDTNPKTLLAQRILAKGTTVRYKDVENNNKKDKRLHLPLFTVGAYLDGWGESNKLLGVGTGLSKKEAGERAAAQALQNQKLLKVYVAKKKAFIDAQMAAQETESQAAVGD